MCLICSTGTEEAPCKSTVRRVAAQLNKSLSEKGLALLVNHGIPEEKLQSKGGRQMEEPSLSQPLKFPLKFLHSSRHL
ncbi:hypothetical protein C0J52_23800 [Blattella germanica]|nr:hypothetical protein C0J52_23800 [Blattella germanica]